MVRVGPLLILWVLGLCLANAILPIPAAWAQGVPVVRQIVVEGVQRIEPDTVRSYLLIQEGDPFDAGRIDRSLKSLFATGLFDDVSIRAQGPQLIVTVVENPIINRIAFEGNKTINDQLLEAETTLRPRVIYTRVKVQNDVERVLTLYRRRGRFGATVEPKVIRLEQNRVDLVFEINEGDETEIERIRFVGNKAFDDGDLRAVIRTKETRWYRFLSSDDTYDPERLTLDRELLRRFYLNEGYADFSVSSAVAELTPDRKDFFVTFTVEEGQRYQFGDIKLDVRLRNLDVEALRKVLLTESGEWYSSKLVDDSVDALTDAVGALGYAFIDVRPRINRNRETLKIDVTFEVGEGPRVFVERIDISGNVRTLDKVIRREFRLLEGDAFNTAKLRRSRQRVQDLGYFEKVEVKEEPGSSPDKAVVHVDVQEKSTGSLSIGAGFSTTNGPLVDFSVQERNLLGRGQRLRLGATVAAKKSQVDVGFTEPYFLDREVSAGFDLFHTNTDLQDTSSFDRRISGGALRAGYPITEDLSQSWKYTVRHTNITNVQDNASAVIKAEQGKSLLSEVSHAILYDQRNSKLTPTDGYFVRLTTDLAGGFGDSRYIRNKIDAGTYYKVANEWVLSLSGGAGYIYELGKPIRISDRFFLGGDDLRGFATAGVGPRDVSTEDALGGEWMYSGSLQLTFPLGLPSELGITGRAFTDFGSAGQLDAPGFVFADTGSLRGSVGAGISWLSPFGAIGLDLGFPFLKEDFDEEELIRINFGTRF